MPLAPESGRVASRRYPEQASQQRRSGGAWRADREFFIYIRLVLVHHIDQMTWLTGLVPREF